MKTIPFLFCVLMAVAGQVKAQTVVNPKSAKAVYAEFLGSGVGLSLNYDTRFRPRLTGLGIRVGAGVVSGFSEGSLTGFTAPVLVNYVIGSNRVALEIGAGVTAVLVDSPGSLSFTGDQVHEKGDVVFGGTGNVGLRLQPRKTGAQIRLYWSPFLSGSGSLAGRIGLSIGLGFR